LAFVAQKWAVCGSFVQLLVTAAERQPQFSFQFLKICELAMHMDKLLFESPAHWGARLHAALS